MHIIYQLRTINLVKLPIRPPLPDLLPLDFLLHRPCVGEGSDQLYAADHYVASGRLFVVLDTGKYHPHCPLWARSPEIQGYSHRLDHGIPSWVAAVTSSAAILVTVVIELLRRTETIDSDHFRLRHHRWRTPHCFPAANFRGRFRPTGASIAGSVTTIAITVVESTGRDPRRTQLAADRRLPRRHRRFSAHFKSLSISVDFWLFIKHYLIFKLMFCFTGIVVIYITCILLIYLFIIYN